MFSFGQRVEREQGGRGEEKTDRRDILSTNFSSRSFDTPLAIIPTHSKAFENLLNLTIFDYLHTLS